MREIFESLNYEPLLFYLKCLDDDNDELEDFIKREIDARNIFVYCKSRNSENSIWVQKELQYIRNSDARRLYTIDIDLALDQTLVTLLISLSDFVKRNNIYISCSHQDEEICQKIRIFLIKHGYSIIRFESFDYKDEHDETLKEIIKNGIFMPIITKKYLDSIYCMSELESALFIIDYGIKPLIMPLIVNCNLAIKLIDKLQNFAPIYLSRDNISDEIMQNILKELKNLQ